MTPTIGRFFYGVAIVKKQCNKCKQFLSISSFQKRKWSKDGFDYLCRQCKSEYKKIKYNLKHPKIIIPDGYRRCTYCKEIKSIDQFECGRRYKDGYYTRCKTCPQIRRKIIDENLLNITKKCSRCGEVKFLYEFSRLKKSKDGFRPSCKQCDRIPVKSGGKTQKIIENLPEGYKRCTKCNVVKSHEEYHKHRSTQDGLTSQCKKCRCKHYREDPQTKIRNRKWRIKNSETCQQKFKEYYYTHKEELNRKNREKAKLPENRVIKNKRRNDRKKRDISYRLEYALRSRLRSAMKSIKNGKRAGSAVRDLGCTLKELKSWLENQFQPGMTWLNWGYGDDKWHVDHIKPLHMFDLTDREQFLEACHYTNLRPLWQKDNLTRTYEEFEQGE